jgi:predicted Rossmann fold nucleotide-binding protein DprA/Smf involved in DNA uptake
VEEILTEFSALVQWERERIVPASAMRQALTKRQQQILEHIAYDPVSVDALLQRAGGELPDLYANLMKLELGGHIVNRAEGYVLSAPQEDAKMRQP